MGALQFAGPAIAAVAATAGLTPLLGLGSAAVGAATACLALALLGIGAVAWRRLGRQRHHALAPETAAAEARAMAPYLSLMREHLSDALQDSETGTLQAIERLNAIHHLSADQLQRISATEDNSKALSEVVRDKLMVDAQLGSILAMFVEKQEAELKANLERIQRLQGVKDLTPMVDVIATVARQTNFLSINAAVEAARAGESGRGFAVVASEIRQLSSRTAAVAVEIAAKISAATDGIDAELATATGQGSSSASSSNMRQVLADVAGMQKRFADSVEQLQLSRVIAGIKGGHEDIADRLSDALSQLQTQDVMRQRVESVQQAMDGLQAHLQGIATLLHGGQDLPPLKPLQLQLREHAASYVMDSQRRTHAEVTGDRHAAADNGPRVELF